MDRTSVQPLSNYNTRGTDVNKRLKAFDDKIAASIAKNDILADYEDPT